MSETSVQKPTTVVWVAIPVILAYMFCYPRLLIWQLGESNPWTNYLYHYGFGVVFFAVGITLIIKERSCQLRRPRDVVWLRVLVGGLIGYLTVHAVWILLALHLPGMGE